MEHQTLLLLLLFFGCLFSYTNGFQDGSSVAASPIASRSLEPGRAALLTALFEFLGALAGGSAVAGSIAAITSYTARDGFLSVLVVAFFCAIVWNFFTRLIKVPSSSTHALVGGLIGSIWGRFGNLDYINFGNFGYLLQPTGVAKVILTLFLSPLIGFVSGFLLLKLSLLVFRFASSRLTRALKRMQWLVLPLLAFGHGANDSQKVMGLLVLALIGQVDVIPLSVRLLVGAAMTLGVVAMAPGIVKRVGSGIYRQRPLHAFVSEMASAVVVCFGSLTGGPVSASQVIASTVMGVGYADRRKGVQWLVARDMLMAWFLTIPCSAVLAYLISFWTRPG